MRLAIRHTTRYVYAPAALRLALRLRLWPSRFDAQRPETWSVQVNGVAVSPLHTDTFGETLGLWQSDTALEGAEITAEGIVETSDAAGVVRGLDHGRALGVFLRDTALTAPDAGLRDLAAAARKAAGDDGPLAALHALQARVHAAIAYKAGVTESDTTAARALALGSGVCQDHAHVFVAAARLLGSPARYVAGYFLPRDPAEIAEDEDPEVGGDLHATHAWAEAHVPGLGWVAFDPANAVCPTTRYIRLCSGLDAAAAAPIRGHVTGATDESLEAEVEITAAAPAQRQSQSQSQTQQ